MRENITWDQANKFLYSSAEVLNPEISEDLYNFVQIIRNNPSAKPIDLVRRILEFFTNSETLAYALWCNG